MKFRPILKYLFILETVSNEERYKKGLKRLGKGYFQAHRLNPYNPLSYLFIPFLLIIGVFMFGFFGFWQQTESRNPFKWH